MGGNKSKPLVQESARVVISRRGAEVPTAVASNLPKVEPVVPTPVVNAVNTPPIPPTATNDSTQTLPPSTPPSTPPYTKPSPDPVALNADILKEISKWQAVRNSEVSTTTAKKMPKSAAQIRVERDTLVENMIKDGIVVKEVLDETQLHDLLKEYREQGVTTAELAQKYNIEETKVKFIVACVRSPILTKDPEEPELFIAS